MSRSRKKTPILAYTTARSEAYDKRLWHKRWRWRERVRLAAIGADDDYLPLDRHAVSNPWNMAKDGKHWWDPLKQVQMAELLAYRRSRFKPERKALQARILTKWLGK